MVIKNNRKYNEKKTQIQSMTLNWQTLSMFMHVWKNKAKDLELHTGGF